jgi:hypothetical protein
MSWTTTAVKIKRNEPCDHEFHNWNEENLKFALRWLKKHAEGDWIVTMYHRTDGGRRRSYGRLS